MKLKYIIYCLVFFFSSFCMNSLQAQKKYLTISKEELKDKIKGGWAGQTIGVTFGGPYEFRFNGTFIQDYQSLHWYDGYLKKTMIDIPGLYDDLYMDLTFVDVFEKYGLDAPVDSFATAFAHAGYMLWHANQAARYNILHGILPPQSGNWMNNPHSDDIDYQIESDFAGLMSPAMPNTASAISDKIGHIMNYGDGWYGGVFVGAMYTQAFIYPNVNTIVSEALRTIPEKSTFHQCIADVIKWHAKYPNDWRQTWLELQKKWSSDIACPDGVFNAFDIDAKINSAYVVLGLLYGQGDYTKSLDVATRAGQDADCNPSTVGGILGAMLGYNKIPAYWKQGLAEAESIDFKYTTMSLNKVYAVSYGHALQTIKRNGGSENGDSIKILLQQPKTVAMEQGFPGMQPFDKIEFPNQKLQEAEFSFDGNGFSILGEARKSDDKLPDVILTGEISIDGAKPETIDLPVNYTTRKLELFWKFHLPKGHHTVKIRSTGVPAGYEIGTSWYVVYKGE